VQSVYMNNFRGFTDATVPLEKVNFFVGENSTGKTSLLALLHLLANPEFWFNLSFNAGEYEFGGYKDIVSVLSSDRSEFQIGFCKYDADEDDGTAFYMLHFRQSKDGLPELFRFSFLSKKYLSTIRVSKKQIAACVEKDLPPGADCATPEAGFAFLRQTPERVSSGYKVLSDGSDHYLRTRPIAMFPTMMASLYRDEDITKHLRSFRFPMLARSFASMAPIRTTPKRTYDGYTKTFSPQGEHTPYVIRKRLTQGSQTNEFKKALDAFGADSGLFESVGITQFGKDSASPFELTITLSAKALRVNSVGYGVSQVLPIIVELLTHGKGSWLAIQQPEVHLHPRAQAALGEVLFHAASRASHTLFVETHSDYLLDRYRTAIRESKDSAGTTQVVFFERTGSGNHAYPMLLENDGEYPETQPPGFRTFFLKEQKRILGV